MDSEKTKSFIRRNIKELEKFLLGLCDQGEKECKKAELINYWIGDYNRYLQFENKFTPKKLKQYKRGDIIKVNFGFNLGNEEGGLHYAVVIDNSNAQASGVITVIPLSSLKQDDVSKYDVSLGNELYNLMKSKFETVYDMHKNIMSRINIEIKECEEEDSQCEEMRSKLNALQGDKEELEKLILEKETVLQNKINKLRLELLECKRKIDYIKKIKKEFDKMSKGSKALVGQITTVSKMRIFDPKQDDDILANIKLSPEKLDDITNRIKELYIYSVDKFEAKTYNKLVDKNNAI